MRSRRRFASVSYLISRIPCQLTASPHLPSGGSDENLGSHKAATARTCPVNNEGFIVIWWIKCGSYEARILYPWEIFRLGVPDDVIAIFSGLQASGFARSIYPSTNERLVLSFVKGVLQDPRVNISIADVPTGDSICHN
jgi:hypothetical protein